MKRLIREEEGKNICRGEVVRENGFGVPFSLTTPLGIKREAKLSFS